MGPLAMGLLLVMAAGLRGCGREPAADDAAGLPVEAKENEPVRWPDRMEDERAGVVVREVEAGVYEITVCLRAGGGAPAVQHAVRLRHGEHVFWEGAVEEIEQFGRAGVPGLSVCWRARPGEVLHGLGERFDSLDLAGQTVEMWIQDAPGQDGGSASYFTTPVLFSRAGYALFAADNPEGRFDLNSRGDGWHRYERAGRDLTFWVVHGADLRELVTRRAGILGGLRGVPDWAWGPWISRNSYENQAEAEEAIEGMVSRGIPVAAIVQEAWKGTSDTGEFNSFSRHGWPEADRFLARCEELGIRNILWQVPILHPDSPHFRTAKDRGYFVTDPEGGVRLREHWLAGFGNIDFTNPEAAAFWKDLMRPLMRKPSIAGFKADDGEDIQPADVFHDGRRGWQMHNEYSFRYARALTELMDEEGVDGFLWSRSGSLGIEQVPGLWAGDQFATWEQMASLIPAGLSAGLSGAPFWGHDIGGYIGDPGAELYVRWAQFGAFSPFMQYHGIEPREPWAFGERVAAIYKRLAHLRMNLRPTLIALGREASETGLPLMRPMGMEFPDDARFLREQTQYMLGPDLLVAPVLEPGSGRRIAFPEGTWHHLLHPVSFEGPADAEVALAEESVPVFVREGAELAVEREAGAELGEWRAGAGEHPMAYGPERAVLRRLSAPFRGDVAARTAEVSFRADPALAGRLVVESRMGEEEPWLEHTLRWAGEMCAADLGRTERPPAAGERQAYRIRLTAQGAEPERLLFRGELRWENPVTVKISADGPGYFREGRRTLQTVLRNSTGRRVPVRMVVDVDEQAAALPVDTSTVLPAHSEKTLDWILDFGPRAGGSDRRIRFHVSSGDVAMGAEEVVFPNAWRWIVAGPFPMPPRAGHGVPLPPEWIVQPDVRFATPEGAVRWWALDADHPVRNDGIDFTEAFGPRDHAVAYAATKIVSDRAQEAELRLGSDDTVAVWLNGRRVHDVETYRTAAPDQEIVPVRLERGTNRVVAKVAQDTGGWKLHFRLTGPSGAPLDGVRDGFADHGDYDPLRPEAERIVPMAEPATWKLAGPFPAGLLESRMKAVGLDALAGLTWQPAAAPLRRDEAMDLAAHLGSRTNSEAYAMLDVVVDKATAGEIRCGSDDGLTLWVNGRERLDVRRPRGFTPDQDVVRVELAPGRNRITARIRQEQGDWKFRAEVWDVSVFPPRPLAR